jgi:hypothetical protein
MDYTDIQEAVPQEPRAEQPSPTGDERTWALGAHLSGLLVPIIGPIVVLVARGEQSAFVSTHAKEALNFQLCVTVLSAILAGCTLVTLGVGTCVTGPIALALGAVYFILAIVAAVKANEGVPYSYPYIVRLIT